MPTTIGSNQTCHGCKDASKQHRGTMSCFAADGSTVMSVLTWCHAQSSRCRIRRHAVCRIGGWTWLGSISTQDARTLWTSLIGSSNMSDLAPRVVYSDDEYRIVRLRRRDEQSPHHFELEMRSREPDCMGEYSWQIVTDKPTACAVLMNLLGEYLLKGEADANVRSV